MLGNSFFLKSLGIKGLLSWTIGIIWISSLPTPCFLRPKLLRVPQRTPVMSCTFPVVPSISSACWSPPTHPQIWPNLLRFFYEQGCIWHSVRPWGKSVWESSLAGRGVTMAPRGGGWTAQPWWVRGRQTRQEVLDEVTSHPVRKERKSISDTGESKSKAQTCRNCQ